MTRYLIRPSRGITAHVYDVLTDSGALAGIISRPAPDLWRYAPKKSNATLTAPTLPALRIAMRNHAAQERVR